LLQNKRGNAFLGGMRALALECATLGAVYGLAQLTIKLTAPGVPDIYQGTEYWDLSLVDPDNRRPVDYTERAATIAHFAEREAAGQRGELARELALDWMSGRIKAFTMWRLLHLRRAFAPTFSGSSYLPLASDGGDGERIVAYMRDDIVVAVPRLVHKRVDGADGLRIAFEDERVLLPGGATERYVDWLTGAQVAVRRDDTGRFLRASDLFATLPVAVLVAEKATLPN
jgi:(1->4)-alpha-D-glucan 1-alpha-D-glucosylmutase